MKPQDEYIATWSGLLELVSDEVTESTSLDFKRDAYADARKPPKKQEEDKDHLRRDATAFANSGGGVLLIGVAEDEQGRAGSILERRSGYGEGAGKRQGIDAGCRRVLRSPSHGGGAWNAGNRLWSRAHGSSAC